VVRKSRQKEADGAADAGPMQIEWSEAEGLKLGRVVKAVGVAAGAPVQRRVDEGVWGLWKQTSAKRSEARRECCGWVSDFMQRGQERWGTELELWGCETFDNGHRSTALGTAPQRVRCSG
jgi:hypothetical protein